VVQFELSRGGGRGFGGSRGAMVARNLALMLLVMTFVMAFMALPNEDRVGLLLRMQGRLCDRRCSLRQQGRSEKDNQ